MIISEPRERARHTSPTDTDTHGPQGKKTQCCGEKKDTNTITQQNTNILAKTKTQCYGENKDTNLNKETQLHSNTQIYWQKQRHSDVASTRAKRYDFTNTQQYTMTFFILTVA